MADGFPFLPNERVTIIADATTLSNTDREVYGSTHTSSTDRTKWIYCGERGKVVGPTLGFEMKSVDVLFVDGEIKPFPIQCVKGSGGSVQSQSFVERSPRPLPTTKTVVQPPPPPIVQPQQQQQQSRASSESLFSIPLPSASPLRGEVVADQLSTTNTKGVEKEESTSPVMMMSRISLSPTMQRPSTEPTFNNNTTSVPTPTTPLSPTTVVSNIPPPPSMLPSLRALWERGFQYRPRHVLGTPAQSQSGIPRYGQSRVAAPGTALVVGSTIRTKSPMRKCATTTSTNTPGRPQGGGGVVAVVPSSVRTVVSLQEHQRSSSGSRPVVGGKVAGDRSRSKSPLYRPTESVTSSTSNMVDQQQQGSSTKPKIVRLFENGLYGDIYNERVPFRAVTIRPNFRTMGAVMGLFTRELQWNTQCRKVDRVFRPDGTELLHVEAIGDGMVLIATGGEKLIPYSTASLSVLADIMKREKANSSSGSGDFTTPAGGGDKPPPEQRGRSPMARSPMRTRSPMMSSTTTTRTPQPQRSPMRPRGHSASRSNTQDEVGGSSARAGGIIRRAAAPLPVGRDKSPSPPTSKYVDPTVVSLPSVPPPRRPGSRLGDIQSLMDEIASLEKCLS